MRALSNLIALNEPDLVLFVGEALVGNDAVDQLVKFNRSLADLAPNAAISECLFEAGTGLVGAWLGVGLAGCASAAAMCFADASAVSWDQLVRFSKGVAGPGTKCNNV
jgi:hypothetical protein